jgi:hypothetical protein
MSLLIYKFNLRNSWNTKTYNYGGCMKSLLIIVICALLVSACTDVTPTIDLVGTQDASALTETAQPTTTFTPSPTATKLPTATFTPSPTIIPTDTPTFTPSPWPGYETAVFGWDRMPFQLRFSTDTWVLNGKPGEYVTIVYKNNETCRIAMMSFRDGGPGPSKPSTHETKQIGPNLFDIWTVFYNGNAIATYTLLEDTGELIPDMATEVQYRETDEACLKYAEQVIADSADLLGQYK